MAYFVEPLIQTQIKGKMIYYVNFEIIMKDIKIVK